MSSDIGEDFYSKLLESSFAKNGSIALAVIFVVLVAPVAVGVVAFEKFGSDKKRTIINKLFSSTCWSVNAFYFFCQLTESFIYVYGPLPESVCFVHLINKRATVTQVSSCSISRVSKLGQGSHVVKRLA